MRKILVVNINWLGDAIFSTPVFKALKSAYPQAHVACLCVPRVEEVLQYCPHIDELIVYDEEGRDRWPWNKLRLITKLRAAQFDAAFLLHKAMTRGLLTALAGIPQRIGYGKTPWLLTHPMRNMDENVHRRDYYLRVLESYGIACDDRRCQLSLGVAETKSAAQKLKAAGIEAGGRFVVLNCGGNWDLKRWPLASWSGLARRISQEGKRKIVFSGSAKDRADIDVIIKSSDGINLAGQTSLGESLAVFSHADAVVSADSGPLHLANSVGAKVIGIFGPTRLEITGPCGTGPSTVLFKDVGCNKAPCYHLQCTHNVCMQSIGVDDVWEVVQKILR